MIKRILSAIAATLAICASLGLPSSAFAASGAITASVKYIKIQDVNVGGSFFVLNSGTAIGRCNMSDGGIMFILPENERGKQMLSLVQTALLSGKQVQVHVDDGGASSNVYCTARFVVLYP